MKVTWAHIANTELKWLAADLAFTNILTLDAAGEGAVDDYNKDAI